MGPTRNKYFDNYNDFYKKGYIMEPYQRIICLQKITTKSSNPRKGERGIEKEINNRSHMLRETDSTVEPNECDKNMVRRPECQDDTTTHFPSKGGRRATKSGTDHSGRADEGDARHSFSRRRGCRDDIFGSPGGVGENH